MNKSDLTVMLEIERQRPEDNDVFYRYRLGDFKLWFSQYENGNIYSVGLVEDGEELKEFDLSAYANEEGRTEKRVGYYPNEFKIRPRSMPMTADDAREFMVKMEKACKVLETVEEFFNTSKHFALYAKAHEVPHFKISAFDYKGHVVCEELYREDDRRRAYDFFLRKHPEYLDFMVMAESIHSKYEGIDDKTVDSLISSASVRSELENKGGADKGDVELGKD